MDNLEKELKKLPGISICEEDSLTVKSHITGNSANLDKFAISLYDYIINEEMFMRFEHARKAVELFKKYYPDEFVTLLSSIEDRIK